MSRATLIEAVYLLAAVCFILALKGLSSPRTARLGNALGAGGMLLAVGVTFADRRVAHLPLLLLAVGIGTVIGVPAARRRPR